MSVKTELDKKDQDIEAPLMRDENNKIMNEIAVKIQEVFSVYLILGCENLFTC